MKLTTPVAVALLVIALVIVVVVGMKSFGSKGDSTAKAKADIPEQAKNAMRSGKMQPPAQPGQSGQGSMMGRPGPSGMPGQPGRPAGSQ